MKKKILLLPLFAFFLLACSNDDSKEHRDILTDTAWDYEDAAVTESYFFGINKRCIYSTEVKEFTSHTFYFTYKIIDDNKVEIYENDGDIHGRGEFNEEILTITRGGSTKIYERSRW